VLAGGSACDLFTAAARRHPRLAYARIGHVPVYLVTSPDLARDVVVGQSAVLIKGRGLERASVLLGQGLLTSEGELWRRQRRLIQPAFHGERVTAYGEQMLAAVRAHEAQWRDGRRLDIVPDMSALTLDVVGRTLFGADLSMETRDVKAALDDVLARTQRLLLPGQLLDRLPLPAVRRARDAMARLDSVVERLVESRRRAGRAGGAGDDVSLLSMLVAARDEEGSPMPDRQLRDEVMTLLLAGHETTAMALSWTWLLIDRHPSAAAALHAELDRVLGPRPPVVADLPALPVTRATIAESMRLYPPAWVFGRRPRRDLDVDGWRVPRGATLLVSPWVLHRDPRWWPEAESFDPTRWLRADGSFDLQAPGQPRDAYLPFGLGRRICVGEGFAWTEATLVLATLAARWQVRVADHDVKPVAALTLRPRGGLPAVLRRRTFAA
jgi:cytochrome P450